MRHLAISVVLISVPLTACHHMHAPAQDASIADTKAIGDFAVAAVYDAFPTRALVETVEVEPAAELGRYMVWVEMSGSKEFRKAYDVVVFEAPNGMMELVSLEEAD